MIFKYPDSVKTEEEMFDFVVKNESIIFSHAKTQVKEADGFGFAPMLLNDFEDKSLILHKNEDLLNKSSLQTKLGINTTNILDSHGDVHIPKMWDKSIKETGKRVLHLAEHKRTFKDIIARGENLKVYTETVSWKSLGFNLEGKTEVLTFDSNILKAENEDMFHQYAKRNVTEHSVGMMYVKMATCIDSEDYPVQKENWDKYEPMIANKEALKGKRMFWAITEAKVIEGSAVPLGSNSFTPTISIKSESTTTELTPEELRSKAIREWLKK